MTKTLSILSIVIAVSFSFGSIFFLTPKKGYVNLNKLFNEFKGMEEARIKFEAKYNTMTINVDSLGSRIEADFNKYQTQKDGLNEKERKLTEELLAEKRDNFFQYKKSLESQLAQEERTMNASIYDDINSFLEVYGEENGYEVIFGVQGDGNILYMDKELDITNEVLKEMNEDFIR